jgi:hypothetical protein
MMKTVFSFGAANNKIAVDPTLGVTYRAKRNPGRNGSDISTQTQGKSYWPHGSTMDSVGLRFHGLPPR